MALNQTFNQDASGNEVVSGTVGITGSVAVTGPATDTQMRATPIPVTSTPVTSATATLTSVNLAVTSSSVLALNASRKGIALFNDSTAIAYIAFGATATTTAFTVKMQPGSFYENSVLYTGAISVIASSAVGALRVTEMT